MTYQLSNLLKIKSDINQQDLKFFDLHFVKSELFSLTWSCGSRQRVTTSSGWIFQLNNLAVKGLMSPRELDTSAKIWKCQIVVQLPNQSVTFLDVKDASLQAPILIIFSHCPASKKHMHTIFTTSANIVQMLWKCFVFAGWRHEVYHFLYLVISISIIFLNKIIQHL